MSVPIASSVNALPDASTSRNAAGGAPANSSVNPAPSRDSRLAALPSGRLTGSLDGANCRGAEKVRRLREAFGEDVRLEAAYGDTGGDHEMLAIAEEQGMRVFKGQA